MTNNSKTPDNIPIVVVDLPDDAGESGIASVFRVIVEIEAEPEGGFSGRALSLDGVYAEGETEAELLKEIKEAANGMIAFYTEDLKKDIPWKAIDKPMSKNCREVLIFNG